MSLQRLFTRYFLFNTFHSYQMTQVSASVEPSIGPVLDRFFVDEILSQVCFLSLGVLNLFFRQVLRWALATPLRFAPTCQVRLLKLFESKELLRWT